MLQNIRILLRYWWIMLVVTLITTAAAAYLSFYFFPAIYSANTTLYVLKIADENAANNDSVYQNLLASEMLVKDYKEMVKADIIIQEVKESLQNDHPVIKNESPKEIADSITVSVKPGTRLIDIQARQKNPEAATAIANKTAEIFKEQSLQLIKTDNVTVISKATVPDAADSPKPLQNIVLGLMAGIFGSIVLIFFIEYIRSQLRAEKESRNAQES